MFWNGSNVIILTLTMICRKRWDVVVFQKKLNELRKVLECMTQGPYF